MTNEEKAKELANKWSTTEAYNRAKISALEMAEYKDGLIRAELENAIRKANLYHDKKLNKWRLKEFIGQITVLSRLLGEEFPTDRLHINFITLDQNEQ